MKKIKLKNTEDFLVDLFTEKANKEYFPHIRKIRIIEALENDKIFIADNFTGCLIWSIFKKNSPIYIGRKGDFQIKQIVVSEKFKGKGTAVKLFLKAKRYAENNGCFKIVLTVRSDNQRAAAFYEKMGMEKIKTTRIMTKNKKKVMVYFEYVLKLKKDNFLFNEQLEDENE